MRCEWGSLGYVDVAGQFVLDPQFDYAKSFSEGLRQSKQETGGAI